MFATGYNHRHCIMPWSRFGIIHVWIYIYGNIAINCIIEIDCNIIIAWSAFPEIAIILTNLWHLVLNFLYCSYLASKNNTRVSNFKWSEWNLFSVTNPIRNSINHDHGHSQNNVISYNVMFQLILLNRVCFLYIYVWSEDGLIVVCDIRLLKLS